MRTRRRFWNVSLLLALALAVVVVVMLVVVMMLVVVAVTRLLAIAPLTALATLPAAVGTSLVAPLARRARMLPIPCAATAMMIVAVP